MSNALMLMVLFAIGIWAGAQNAVAGGGSFLTLPALMFAGLDPLSANVTSTVALFPGQVAAGWTGRRLVCAVGGTRFRSLVIVSLLGGICGAFLLLNTPTRVFARLVPWLLLSATSIYIWGNFLRRSHPLGQVPARRPEAILAAQFFISVYGGYFGGGISFLMMAVLTWAGVPPRFAAGCKNVLAAVMNAAAVVVFLASPDVAWAQMAALCMGGIIGGWAGARLLFRIPERVLRLLVASIGVALTVVLFLRQA